MSFITNLLFQQGFIVTPAALAAVEGDTQEATVTASESRQEASSHAPRVTLSPEVCT